MKVRESGIPEEQYWSSFFDAECALNLLMADTAESGDIAEFGCGYGTFTLPAARRTSGVIAAMDIDPEMVECVRQKAASSGLTNVRSMLCDFVTFGAALAQPIIPPTTPHLRSVCGASIARSRNFTNERRTF